jgi:hypothetical protein
MIFRRRFGLERKTEQNRNRRTTLSPRISVDELERRVTPATLTNFEFQIPAAVANMGVQLAIFGQTSSSGQQYLADNSGSYKFENDPSKGLLPMITLSNPSKTNQQPVTVSIPIPAVALNAGVAVMFVGPNAGLPINSSGVAAAPTVTTNPNDTYSIFELTNAQQSPGNYQLDVDISEIDQVGFTYTVTSSNGAPYPLGKVGMTPARSTFFTEFNNTFAKNNTAFLESSTLGKNSLGQQLRLVAPQTILGTYEKNGPSLISASVVGTGGNGGLTPGTSYYYLITAKSATGESAPSAFPSYAGVITNNNSSVVLNWQAYTGIQTGGGQNHPFVSGSSVTTGYNIYRASDDTPAVPPQDSAFQLIGSVSGANTTTFTDPGLPAQNIAPPTSSYGFDPLTTYFTPVINNFFSQYTPAHPFVYVQAPQSPGQEPTTFTGITTQITPYWTQPDSNASYTVLKLTGSGGEFNGQTFYVFDPMFSTNTNNPNLPPMPSWMANVGSAAETPSQMVFACDGVFASNMVDPIFNYFTNDKTDAEKSLGNIENMIVSAINRGVSTLSPSQWVNPMQFTADPSPSAQPGGSLTPGQTYYYMITSVGPGKVETVPTREVAATVGAGQNSITLNWTAVPYSVANSFNIYRGTTSGGEVLIASVPNYISSKNPNPLTSFSDLGGQPASNVVPPYQYYAPGSTSNLYSAFLHQNSTTNPKTGISVNGLVYGYPFDDQGDFSTNIQFPVGTVPTTITFAINPFTSTPTPPTPSNKPVTITTTAGVPFNLDIQGTTGETISFATSDPRADLPAPYTFDAADNGSHVFTFIMYQAGVESLVVTGNENGFTQADKVIVLPAAANHIAFSSVPTTDFIYKPFIAIVGVYDAFGNLVTDAGGIVKVQTFNMKGTRSAPIMNGTAQFVISPTRPGYTYLQADSRFGVARSGAIDVTVAEYYTVKASPIAVEGKPYNMTVVARTPIGRLDRNYRGTVDVFEAGRLVGFGDARNGIAQVNVSMPPGPGLQFLLLRDAFRMSLMGKQFVHVIPPRGFHSETRFFRRR